MYAGSETRMRDSKERGRYKADGLPDPRVAKDSPARAVATALNARLEITRFLGQLRMLQLGSSLILLAHLCNRLDNMVVVPLATEIGTAAIGNYLYRVRMGSFGRPVTTDFLQWHAVSGGAKLCLCNFQDGERNAHTFCLSRFLLDRVYENRVIRHNDRITHEFKLLAV
jgi:hypothetical protein